MRTTPIWAALVALVTACGGAPAAEPPPEQQGDDLDSLDLANSWTDATNPKSPDLAGPIWWPWVMKLRGPKYELHAVASGRPREPIAVFSGSGFAETGAFQLAAGHYGVLVQYKENGTAADGASLADVTLSDYEGGALMTVEPLGALTVSSDNPVGSGGWRRAYFRFEVTAGDDGLVRRVHLENATQSGWQFGLVAVHREERPFYGIAHNPDSVARLYQAIAQGANALEPDLRHTKDAPNIAADEDGNVAVTEQGIFGGASDVNGQATLGSYLRELGQVAPHKLVIWDTKTGDSKDYGAMAQSIKAAGAREGFDFGKSVFNISDGSMSGLFWPFADDAAVGRDFDGIFTQVHSHTADEWMGPVRANRITFQGLGVTPQLQVNEKWSVPIAVYVRAREQEEFPKKIYFWTVNDGNAMRRVLDLGIDGLITDDLPLLQSILQEPPYASMYRYAGEDDDPGAKHGGSWFSVAASEDLDP